MPKWRYAAGRAWCQGSGRCELMAAFPVLCPGRLPASPRQAGPDGDSSLSRAPLLCLIFLAACTTILIPLLVCHCSKLHPAQTQQVKVVR